MDLKILFLLLTAKPILGLIGYDCGGPALNISTFSLSDVGNCQKNYAQPNHTNPRIQLVQLTYHKDIEVIQCRIEVERYINYCGMHSHTSNVENGRREYLVETDYHGCKHMHDTNSVQFNHFATVDGLKPNVKNHRSITLAGHSGVDGTCKGASYSDQFGTWDGVVVEVLLRITYLRYTAKIDLKTEKIKLKSGGNCDIHGEMCEDNGYYTFWKNTPTDTCSFESFRTLYTGPATKFEQTDDSREVYTVTSDDTTFALDIVREAHTCGYTIKQTEIYKLYIIELKETMEIPVKTHTPVEELDLFAYMNSKFVYIEKHIRTQMQTLYKNTRKHRCEAERETLKNTLSLATIAPDEFAFKIAKGPGYHATIAGELIHLIKCTPVEVTLINKEGNQCFQEAPVSYNNQTYFLTKKTKVLMKHSASFFCNPTLPVGYKIDNNWYYLNPKPTIAPAPQILKPDSYPTWRYDAPKHLGTSGIYSHNELENLRDRIMSNVEKTAILDNFAHLATGNNIPQPQITLANLLDEKTIDHMIDSTFANLWQHLITFGSIASAIIAIMMILHLIKLFIDTIINGIALHKAFGWSTKLLGAFFNSITNILLHLGNPNSFNPAIRNQHPEIDIEAGTSNQPFQRNSSIRLTGVDRILLKKLQKT